MTSHWHVFPEVPGALDELQARHLVIGAVSNWVWSLPELLHSLELVGRFDFIAASARVEFEKPHPGIFRYALKQAGVRPSEVIHVGDHLDADVEGAINVGITPVLIDRNQRFTRAEVRPDVPIITALDQLLPIVDARGVADSAPIGMIERWRCFIAVPLPPGLRVDLTDVVSAWRGEPDGLDLRWTDPAGWRLTLAFLGWVEAGLAEEILGILVRPARDGQRVDLAAGGLGAFRSARRARVVVRPDRCGRRRRVACRRDPARSRADIPRVDDGSPFQPHVTLARARAERGLDLASWMAGRAVPSGVVPLERVILYRSHLGRGPAHYEPLGAVTVGTGAHIVRNVEAEASVHG